MNSITKIARLRTVAAAAKLTGREVLQNYTDSELAQSYNGIGPEHWPAWLRRLCTFLNCKFEAAALIHDVRFNASDGTIAKFSAANAEFENNLHKLLQFAPPRTPWGRCYWQHRLQQAVLAVRLGGWRAWREAGR